MCFQAKGLSVAHVLYYIVYTYSMVGRSTASISDLGGIFTEAWSTEGSMLPRVWYIGYRPPYCTIYSVHVMSYLNFSPKSVVSYRGIPWISCEISAERPYPVHRLAAGAYCRTLSLEDSVVWTWGMRIRSASDLQTWNVPRRYSHTIICSFILNAVHRKKRHSQCQAHLSEGCACMPCERMQSAIYVHIPGVSQQPISQR